MVVGRGISNRSVGLISRRRMAQPWAKNRHRLGKEEVVKALVELVCPKRVNDKGEGLKKRRFKGLALIQVTLFSFLDVSEDELIRTKEILH